MTRFTRRIGGFLNDEGLQVTISTIVLMIFNVGGCCVDLPDTDTDVPALSVSVSEISDSDPRRMIVYNTAGPRRETWFETTNESVKIAFAVRDNGGLKSIKLDALRGRLGPHSKRRPLVYESDERSDSLTYTDDGKCHYVHITEDAVLRRRDAYLVTITLEASDLGVGGVSHTNTTPEINIVFRRP
jgi:hypothetical protein